MGNKGQLTARFNRKDSVTTNAIVVNKKRHYIMKAIEHECDKPIVSKFAVNASKTYKANNYDILKESMRLFRLQCRYNSCDFDEIYRQREERHYFKEKARLDAVEERNKINKIAREKSAQAVAVATFNKNTLSGAFRFHQHASIVSMACR